METSTEILRLWNLVSEITDQLNSNRLITSRLQSQIGQLQEQAGQASDVVILRRFNTDLSKENFTSELERLSVALVMENQSLLHENKQLNSLMQEYEKTLETVMNKFRGHCQAAQTHQLTLGRHYETLLSRDGSDDMPATSAMGTDHMDTLSTLIRRALRSMEGEDRFQDEHLELEGQECEDLEEQEKEKSEHESCQGMGDWAEERETEIQRLELENTELRRMLGISREQERELGLEDGGRDAPLSSPPWDRSSFSRSSSFRDNRSRAGARPSLSLTGGGPQRRSGLPVFLRRGFGDVNTAPERVESPPNEIRWGMDAASGLVIESI